MIARLTGSLWVRALLTAAVLAFLAWRIDLRAALDAILRLDRRAAVIVLGLLALDRAIMIWRWVILLSATGHQIAVKSAVWIYLVSSFVGSFLPAGVGGDAARAYTLSQRTSQGSAAVASVAVDRLLGLVSIVAIAFVALVIAGPNHLPGSRGLLLAVAAALLAGMAALFWADRWVRAIWPTERLVRIADAFSRYRGHAGALGAVLLLSMVVQLLRILQAWLMGVGIGIEVPFAYYLLFMPVGLIALMLPISLNGFGLPQGVIVWLLQPVGVPTADAFALSTLIVLSGIVANLPGAWLYLRSRAVANASVRT